MQEKDLIKKIKQLREIEVDKDWVLRTKTRILGEQELGVPVFSFQWKNALVFSCIAVVLFGCVVFVKPDNRAILYSYLHSFEPINKAFKKEQEQRSENYLALAEQKMEELKEIAGGEDNEALASAIQETTDVIRKATASIPETSDSPTETLQYVQRISKIQAEKQEINQLLGSDIDLGDKELEDRVLACIEKSMEDTESEKEKFVKEVVAMQIKSLNKNTNLSEQEQEDLSRAEGLYETGDYSGALETLLLIGK